MFETLFESLPDGVLVVNGAGELVRLNGNAEKMFGYTRNELVGKSIETLLPERFRRGHVGKREAYSRQPHMRPMGVGLDLRARRKDGMEFPVDIMLSPVRIEDQVLVLAVVRDITYRKQAEEKLRRNEELFRSLIEGVKDYAIFMLDSQGRVMSWSPGAEVIHGYRAEEVVGQHFSVFFTPEDVRLGKPEEILRAASTRGRMESEGWRIRKDGARFWANAIVTALRDEKGQILGFSKVTRDLTDRRRAEEALLLEITNALVSNLDIRNLLGAIAASIRQMVPYDYGSLALLDPAGKLLQLQWLDRPEGAKVERAEWTLPFRDSVTEKALSRREPVVLHRMETGEFEPDTIMRWKSIGMNSGCWLPLVSHGRRLGALIVGSEREGAFSERDVTILTEVANQVAIAVDNAVAFRQIVELQERLEEEKRYLAEELRTEYNFEEIIGETPALKRVLKQVETVAPTDSTVLILGETGTGKELIARAIHQLSARRDRPFIKLNCSAIPGGLLESELFGHEKGAFTGAISQKMGRLELAHSGTFFLDEVGDLPLELQPKLLRALQEREFERVGGTRTIPVDVRLVAATNQDLQGLVNRREFRSDLYYRLKVFPITIPPLRERSEDIPLLAHYFAQKHAKQMKKSIERIPPQALHALVQYPWHGNVRELENLIERAVILTRGSELNVPLAELQSAVPASPAPVRDGRWVRNPGSEPGAPQPEGSPTLEAAEREHILRALRECRGVIGGASGAAAKLGLKRTTLNFRMRKLGISRSDL